MMNDSESIRYHLSSARYQILCVSYYLLSVICQFSIIIFLENNLFLVLAVECSLSTLGV